MFSIMKEWKTRMLCEGALFVAMAQVLGFLKLWEFPWGGSVTLSMLPVFIFSVRWGCRNAFLASFAFGLLQFLFDGGFALTWQSMIGDYILAFGVLGLAGLFQGKRWGIFAGAVVGSSARFVVHYVVGATIWAAYMPDEFFGMTMTSPWTYSFLYNGSYMLIDLVLCLVAAGLMYRPLYRFLIGLDLVGAEGRASVTKRGKS